jgi:hypothetical protein
MAEVRFLATKAERDAAGFREVLVGHTRVLNALRETQLEQGVRLDRVEGKVDRLVGTVDGLEGKVDRLEGEMKEGFAKLGVGQAQITALLTAHLDKPGADR